MEPAELKEYVHRIEHAFSLGEIKFVLEVLYDCGLWLQQKFPQHSRDKVIKTISENKEAFNYQIVNLSLASMIAYGVNEVWQKTVGDDDEIGWTVADTFYKAILVYKTLSDSPRDEPSPDNNQLAKVKKLLNEMIKHERARLGALQKKLEQLKEDCRKYTSHLVLEFNQKFPVFKAKSSQMDFSNASLERFAEEKQLLEKLSSDLQKIVKKYRQIESFSSELKFPILSSPLCYHLLKQKVSEFYDILQDEEFQKISAHRNPVQAKIYKTFHRSASLEDMFAKVSFWKSQGGQFLDATHKTLEEISEELGLDGRDKVSLP